MQDETRQDEWLWEAQDYSSLIGDQQSNETQRQQQTASKDDLRQEIEALKQQLAMWQSYMWQQYITGVVNNMITQVIQQKPYLDAWKDELRAGLAHDIAVWLQQKQSEQANISWEDAIAYMNEALKKRAEAIEAKLSTLGVNIGTQSQAPVVLPGSGAVTPSVGGTTTTEEKFPGVEIPLNEETAIRIVPESYIEQLRREQLRQYIRDRIADAEKKRQGGILPRRETETVQT